MRWCGGCWRTSERSRIDGDARPSTVTVKLWTRSRSTVANRREHRLQARDARRRVLRAARRASGHARLRAGVQDIDVRADGRAARVRRAIGRARAGGSPPPLALRLSRFPFGQLDAIALHRVLVQVENAWRAAAVAAVFEFRLLRRGRTRIVGRRFRRGRLGHGTDRVTESVQYKWMPRDLPAAPRRHIPSIVTLYTPAGTIPAGRFPQLRTITAPAHPASPRPSPACRPAAATPRRPNTSRCAG